jgi:YidC/Oxa1 family membrane protein insertase
VEPRRLLLAFVLSMAVIALWYWLFPPPTPPKPVPARDGTSAGAPSPVPQAAAPGAAPGRVVAPATAGPAVAGGAEERLTIENGGTQATFSNRGAQLVSLIVAESSRPGSARLEMVRRRGRGPYPFGLTGQNLSPSPLNGALFAIKKGEDGHSVRFVYSGPAGAADKEFRLDGKGFLEADIHVPGSPRWGMVLGPGLRNPTAEEMESRFERREAVYKAAGRIERLDAQGAAAPRAIRGADLQWAGLDDHYFLTAVVPRSPVARIVATPRLVVPGERDLPSFEPVPKKDDITPEQKKLKRELLLVIEGEGDRLRLTSFWGAKELERLTSLPGGLDGSVNLGMFGILARPLLAGLRWIHDHVVANYGWSIVLMTSLIKLVLLPVTHKSTMSMRKMQELNPRVQAIRDKFKGKLRDKQGRPNLEMQRKMQEETMAIYRSAGVNPASGCFPLLLQMPIFFAYYSVLSSAVELRGAPWIGWIQDLSVAEPHLFKVLPLVMGVTQFIQVRMGPQATDPMQRRMFQFMPIMMTVFLWGFPAGLALYWLTNNVLTIAQLAVYKRLQEKQG